MQLLEVESVDDVYLFKYVIDGKHFLYAMNSRNALGNPFGVVYLMNGYSVDYEGDADAPFSIDNCVETQLSQSEVEECINDGDLEFNAQRFKGFLVPDESMNGITVLEL